MKKLAVSLQVILTAAVVLGLTLPCHAENMRLMQACETKAEQAAALIKQLGPEAAYIKITDPNGPFIDKESHVFCINSDSGTLLAHKIARFVGVNMHNYRDADQKAPYSAILEKAIKSKSGWVTYMTYGSGPDKRETPGLKQMHFLKVPGRQIVLCCGYWDE